MNIRLCFLFQLQSWKQFIFTEIIERVLCIIRFAQFNPHVLNRFLGDFLSQIPFFNSLIHIWSIVLDFNEIGFIQRQSVDIFLE